MSKSPTEYLSHLIYVLTVYKALWNCLSISVNSSKTLLADHSNTYNKEKHHCSLHFHEHLIHSILFLVFSAAWKWRTLPKYVCLEKIQVNLLLCVFTWLLLDSTSHMQARWAWTMTTLAKFTYLVKSCNERTKNHISLWITVMCLKISHFLWQIVTWMTSRVTRRLWNKAQKNVWASPP